MVEEILMENEAKTLPAGRQAPKRVFFAATLVMFFSVLSIADSIGFVPCAIDGSCTAAQQTVALSNLPQLGDSTALALKTTGVLPARITIGAIGLDLPVQNPYTRDIEKLDALLPKGPVRYVDSAELGRSGNMIIFAHSSQLPIVRNKMFQAFNNIHELKAGDAITLMGTDGKSYLYNVESVTKTDVEAGTTIDLSPSIGTKLTLVTCDTLSGKSARYILEAQFVGVI